MVEPRERKNHECLLPSEHYPWVVYYGKDLSIQTFCSLSHPHEIFHKSIPELCGVTKTVAHCSGWLVLCKGETHYSIWNPTDSNLIQLPPLSLKPDQALHCCTLSSPGDPNCAVMLFDATNLSLIFIRPEAEQKKWVGISYGQLISDMGLHNDDRFFLEDCLCCNGKIYYLPSNSSNLATIKVDKDDKLVIEPLPCRGPKFSTYTKHNGRFLAELCGELFCIYISYGASGVESYEVIQVDAFKLDFTRMIWIRVTNLMGQAIFFNGHYAISCAASSEKGIECDSIYFIVDEDNCCFYCFNMKDCHLKVNSPCPTLTSQSSPMFLMPRSNIRLTSNHEQVENKPSKEKQGAENSKKIDEKEDSMKETEVATTKFHGLPIDVLQLISNFLNLFDLTKFRAASRDCWLAVPALKRKQALEKLEGSSLFPWLLFPSNDMTLHNFLDPKHNCRFSMTVPETLVKAQLRFVKDGWLLMSDCENLILYYNPFTKATLDLPGEVPQRLTISDVMGFSTLPTSPECLVVGFEQGFEGIGIILGIKAQEEWHTFFLECDFFMNQSCPPVFHDGNFYLLGKEGNLLVFKYEVQGVGIWENIHWNVFNNPTPCESYQLSYILEWDGQVTSVFVGHIGKWVQVLKLNSTTMSWESVESLGNYTFLVSRFSCLAIETRIMGMQNRIYFPRVHGDNILYYSLETRKFHYDGQGCYLENFHNTKEQLLAGWFDPRYFH